MSFGKQEKIYRKLNFIGKNVIEMLEGKDEKSPRKQNKKAGWGGEVQIIKEPVQVVQNLSNMSFRKKRK